MKATLIMKNGMSIDINDPKHLSLNGHKVENMHAFINALSTKRIPGTDIDLEKEVVTVEHVLTDEEGNDHVFTYSFGIEAYSWGFIHEKV